MPISFEKYIAPSAENFENLRETLITSISLAIFSFFFLHHYICVCVAWLKIWPQTLMENDDKFDGKWGIMGANVWWVSWWKHQKCETRASLECLMHPLAIHCLPLPFHHLSICACCHPCTGAMQIFSVSFQFYHMSMKRLPLPFEVCRGWQTRSKKSQGKFKQDPKTIINGCHVSNGWKMIGILLHAKNIT